jgi:hypothetical protein
MRSRNARSTPSESASTDTIAPTPMTTPIAESAVRSGLARRAATPARSMRAAGHRGGEDDVASHVVVVGCAESVRLDRQRMRDPWTAG